MIQRRVFPLVAFAVAVAAMFGLRLPVAAEVVVLAVSVLLLGIPHGALDVLHARDAQQLQRPAQWARFLLRYVAIALLVVAVWTIAPSASLVGLLVISALHFSGDLERGSPLALRAVHGAVPVCLPALLHRDELGELFAALAPVDAARSLAAALEVLSLPVLLGSMVCVILYARRCRAAALEVAATAAVCSVASPLLGFLVYFCLLHSWRHVDRTRRIYRPAPATMIWSAALPTAATALGALAAWLWIEPRSLESGLLQLVFVGLAALTVPHMLLIERVRLRGWQARGVPQRA